MTMKRTSLWLLGAAVFTAGWVRAQPAVVEAVQYPAWLERGGHSVPLTPGTHLQGKDKLVTGGNARVQLRMGEGSAVKLGENAQFVIERAEDVNVFRAALSVIAGAFRFTTSGDAKERARNVAIKVKNVTVGIRGTDLWGKSTGERDWVVLLEGKISVGSEGNPTVSLDKPLDLYQKPRDGAPEVTRVDQAQVDLWSRETELSGDGAAARVGGQWRVVAAVKSQRDDANKLRSALRGAGYPAEVIPKGGQFLVQIPGLAGEAESRALMASIRSIKGVHLPTVHEGPP
jgi:hypothetical protein